MLSDAEKQAIRESWQLVLPVVETAADLFYRRLAEQNPALRARGQDQLVAQRKEFVTTFSFVVRGLAWEASEWRSDAPDEDDLFLGMLALGQRGSRLARLIEQHYSATGDTLLWTLTYALGKRFDAKARAAWMRLYTLLAIALRLGRLASPSSAHAALQPPSADAGGDMLEGDISQRPTRELPAARMPTDVDLDDGPTLKPTPIARIWRGASS
jgi:hemoglobin-like flavoprotein